MTQSPDDSIQRFHFADLDIRGEVARLDATWAEVIGAHDYPLPVQRLLGELLTATALLANIVKVDGTLTVQASGDGPVSVLMAECRNRETLRGIARLRGAVDGPLPPAETAMGTELLGRGLVTITIRPDGSEPYQGIVPLTGATLAEALEGYFAQSEQIPTRLWLTAADARAAGLLIQALPPELARAARTDRQREEDFTRVTLLADTLGAAELRGTANETLLHRLFHEEQVRVQARQPLAFRCTCSRERTREAMRTLPRSELETILAEDGFVEMDCQFCHEKYRFDAIDLELVMRAEPEPGPEGADDPH
jgi:molecular chaperone Hsp33